MLKRFLSLLVALLMTLGCAAAETAVEVESVSHQIEMKVVPVYVVSPENYDSEGFPLYFADGVKDLPYVELTDWTEMMNELVPSATPILNADYHLGTVIDEEGGLFTLVRENESFMTVDFNTGSIVWNDYCAFIQAANGPYQDLSSMPPVDENGQPNLLTAIAIRSKHGGITGVNLSDYNIPTIAQDGKYLLPMQTLCAFMLYPYFVSMYYNQECVMLSPISEMKTPYEDMTNELLALVTPEMIAQTEAMGLSEQEAVQALLGVVSETEEGTAVIKAYGEEYEKSLHKIYASAPEGERSKELTWFGFHELVLELDSFYGLKDVHHIDSFDEYLFQTSLDEALLGTSTAEADSAIADLVSLYLDDGHSAFISPSYLQSSGGDNASGNGFSVSRYSGLADRLSQLRQKYPDATAPYYEVGDTAFVRMDEFEISPTIDYYAAAASGQLPDPTKDTISLLVQAHQKITRENSPIKNVVLDLSTNGGGAAPAAIYTIAWFLGDAQVSSYNTFSGAETTTVYRADVNLDHQYDEKDSLSHLRLFCLTSPVSFSCGNLVPWAFKEDGRVTLLGRVSGGGSCVVQPMTTAWGTSFQISGSKRLSFLKNGAYYDVDQGVEPDFIIMSYENFYDRQALADYISRLF